MTKKKKKEKRNAKRIQYYHENKESINRKLQFEFAAHQQVDDSNTASDSSCKPKKYDWALYKHNQRAKAKEEMKKKEKGKRTRSDSGTAFPTRMSKKRRVSLLRRGFENSSEFLSVFRSLRGIAEGATCGRK